MRSIISDSPVWSEHSNLYRSHSASSNCSKLSAPISFEDCDVFGLAPQISLNRRSE